MLGGIAVVVMTAAYGGWVASDDFTPTGTGADRVDAWVWTAAVVFQVVTVAAAVAAVAWVVQGCRRHRRLTTDGKLLLAWLSMLWLDPTANYLRPQFLFSSVYVNRGSWVEHLPGWRSAGGAHLPSSLLVEVPAYAALVMTSVLGSRVMARARRRRPDLGPLALCALVLALFEVVFLAFGMLLVAIRFAAWPRVLPWFGLGTGHWWQYPFTETTAYGAVCTAMAALRFFREDPDGPDGPTFVERGADRLPVGPRLRSAACALAVVGFGNAAMVGYAAVSMAGGPHLEPVAHDYPTWLTNGTCGPGTPYAC